MDWRSTVVSSLEELEGIDTEGEKVAVGFRPSGSLHTGNLLTIAYAAVLAQELGKDLEMMCCDTDWSAHIHKQHMPEVNEVMRLFFRMDCPCGEHENIAYHRAEEIRPFLDGLESELEIELDIEMLSRSDSDEYLDAVRRVLDNMDSFDEVFGGGFLRRYHSPVASVCPGCGNSFSKGSAYSGETDELNSPCRNPDCDRGFAPSQLEGPKGVYYLVDPVRDPSRDVAVHVFGGDYRVAEKGQKTSKIAKVAKITELATGERPAYFMAPLISDEDGRPLSKSKGTGKTVDDIDDLEAFARETASKVRDWINEERRYVRQDELLEMDNT